jgi:hypothetical protein
MATENLAHIIMKAFDCPKDTVEGTAMVFNFRNNFAGKLFLRMLRKALNRSVYSIRVRGSNADRVSLRKQGIHVSDQSVPLKYADRFRVYIDGIKFQAPAEINYWHNKADYWERRAERAENTLKNMMTLRNEHIKFTDKI